MPSIMQQHITDLDAFLRRNRRAYPRTVAAEMGMPGADLREIAAREISALAEFIADPRRGRDSRPVSPKKRTLCCA